MTVKPGTNALASYILWSRGRVQRDEPLCESKRHLTLQC